jgi:hypothetical protein
MFALALFPFISTVTGASLKLDGLGIWKYLWLLWLGVLLVYIVRGRGFFDKWGGRIETTLWVFIAFMLVFAPEADLVVDPWKNWFFCTLAVVMFRLIASSSGDELHMMIKSILCLWWAYAVILFVYVKNVPFYPGSIQHQFFLSGLLGLVAGLLLLSQPSRGNRWLYRILLVSTLVNVLINLAITEARSAFPFSLALVLISAAWLRGSARPTPRLMRQLGLPLALLLTLLPLLHLSGAMGNLVNELTYPIFGKLRTVESKSGREAAFRAWSGFVVENAHALGPAKKPMPSIHQEIDTLEKPLFGMSQDQFNEARKQGMQAQAAFRERQRALGEESSNLNASIAITSSHNLWLDASARSGLLYAATIAWAFIYVVWLISARLSLSLPVPLALAYWAMAVAWGFASQFDDEHWLYHIPYLTLFFIPVIASAMRVRAAPAMAA